MSETPSEHRLAENEAIFRRINEQVQAGYDETNKLAREDNQPEFKVPDVSATTPLQFYCECADESCAKRLAISLQDYQEIHQNRKRFVVVPGHEVLSVETVVSELPAYTIVEKNVLPPEEPEAMHPTSIGNS
ncbi:MAG: hypothetical protein ABIR37_00510 [Candidatus Saccharimonadales bacterium]